MKRHPADFGFLYPDGEPPPPIEEFLYPDGVEPWRPWRPRSEDHNMTSEKLTRDEHADHAEWLNGQLADLGTRTFLLGAEPARATYSLENAYAELQRHRDRMHDLFCERFGTEHSPYRDDPEGWNPWVSR